MASPDTPLRRVSLGPTGQEDPPKRSLPERLVKPQIATEAIRPITRATDKAPHAPLRDGYQAPLCAAAGVACSCCLRCSSFIAFTRRSELPQPEGLG